jgi:hypothetical protein
MQRINTMESLLIKRQWRQDDLHEGRTVIGTVCGRKISYNIYDQEDIAADIAALFDCDPTIGMRIASCILWECGLSKISDALSCISKSMESAQA